APGTFIFFVGFTGYVFIQITHQPTDVIQTHPVVSTNTVAALSMANIPAKNNNLSSTHPAYAHSFGPNTYPQRGCHPT
ncbi:MAG: hypothetical protein ACJAV1_003132, partial [Paraglaciecola sp.]